jgi:catechol 2,3-dioxygenase-like lactoylglutathione lyase family enzyme
MTLRLSVATMTNHITSLHIRSLPVLDQDEALAFYTSHLGFELRDDIDLGFMRWLTIGVPGQDTSILLELVGGPQHDEATAVQVRELVTKGALGGLFLLSDDVHATFAALRGAGVDITQEPVEQPYGTDFGVRDPFGNHIRISQPNTASSDEIQASYDRANS